MAMQWNETVASNCRYGDVIGNIFKDAEIIWESSENNYQGYANVFARMPNGSFVHYEWTYGSCSGCDEWEARGLTDEQIEQEVRKSMAILPNVDCACRYLCLEGEYSEASIPTANKPDNGSLPGMLRILTGSVGAEFSALGKAFDAWLKQKEETHDRPDSNPIRDP